MKVFEFAAVARIAVPVVGADFKEQLDCEESLLADRNLRVMQLWLDISSPGAGKAVGVLRERGYFFGGVFPRWFGGDALLMQCVNGQPEWEDIHLYSERAERIYRHIHDDWQSVRQCAKKNGGLHGSGPEAA